jgi:hypothetical protein
VDGSEPLGKRAAAPQSYSKIMYRLSFEFLSGALLISERPL